MDNKIKQQNKSDFYRQLTPSHDPPDLPEMISVIQKLELSYYKLSQFCGKLGNLQHRIMDALKHIIQFHLGYD